MSVQLWDKDLQSYPLQYRDCTNWVWLLFKVKDPQPFFQAKGEIKNRSKMARLDIQPRRPEIKQTQGQEAGAMAKSLGSLKQAVKSREAEGKLRGNSALLAFFWEGTGPGRCSGRRGGLKLKICFNMGVRYSFWSRLTNHFSVPSSLTLLPCNAQTKSGGKKRFL